MAEIASSLLTGVDVNRPVLATLADANVAPAAKTALSSTLSTALTTLLQTASTGAGYADLAQVLLNQHTHRFDNSCSRSVE